MTDLDIPQNKIDSDPNSIVSPRVTLYKALSFWSLVALAVKVSNWGRFDRGPGTYLGRLPTLKKGMRERL